MKTHHLSSLLILAAALSATVFAKASNNNPAMAYPTPAVTLHTSHGDDQVALGDSREKVRLLMDCPNQEITRDVWLYHGFSADLKKANVEGCRSLIITFSGNKVVDL